MSKKMRSQILNKELGELKRDLNGELEFDDLTTTIYSTDASVYKERPLAVAWPKDSSDIKKLLSFAADHKIGLITRAAGTSLAGQVVGNGIVMDVSKHLNKILELNEKEMWVRVEPGVVLDELNLFLKQYGLFFGPETSTSNRCNLGGMVGNNACGSHSIVYGSTRDHLLELKTILSDGSTARFHELSREEFAEKCCLQNLEGDIYRNIRDIFEDPLNRLKITEEYPDPKIKRRNTGYALDILLDNEIFGQSDKKFNMCKLLAGSEGTLAITTEIKLNLVKLPPPEKALVCVHLKKRHDAFKANLVILKHSPSAVEMMDDKILALARESNIQIKNCFFPDGDPGGLLFVEFVGNTKREIEERARTMIEELISSGFGYSFPIVWGKETAKVWNLRKAGLGVLFNMKGDAKPVALIEDTAVCVEDLPEYMDEFEKILRKYNKDAVYYAHIGTGELHIRPILNLKDINDSELFRKIGTETAILVKKYRGSMSGEHGDGRLRGEFIPIIIGDHNYELLKSVKKCWDPKGILNPNKITDTLPMNKHLRYTPGQQTPEIDTIFDFSSTLGIVRAAEKCNGSGDCRKSSIIGGTMCPSFMATGDEKNSTRARANVFREYIQSDPQNIWDHREIYEIMDLCISCKGCKSECPTVVDIAKLKAEFMQHWHDNHGVPLRTRLIAHITQINKIGSLFPSLFNWFVQNRFFSGLLKAGIGFSKERSIPTIYKTSLEKWIGKNLPYINPEKPKKTVCLFVDEFSNYNDTLIGIKAIKLLTTLGYRIIITEHLESSRTFISKGLIRKAKKIATKNVDLLSGIISGEVPLIGIEPSAILTFRDEYPDLVEPNLKEKAKFLSANCFLIDEFLSRENDNGKIDSNLFSKESRNILLHTHCQQKSISSSSHTINILNIPANYDVQEIPSGCCGMAGSFGYEKEHYDLSLKIGEMVLFPAVREADINTIIAATGTSCRQQIMDGTGRTAYHPIEILYDALIK
jgi:FAD/FMN-containing dehydrogenase/Fe-S oxidoreductase